MSGQTAEEPRAWPFCSTARLPSDDSALRYAAREALNFFPPSGCTLSSQVHLGVEELRIWTARGDGKEVGKGRKQGKLQLHMHPTLLPRSSCTQSVRFMGTWLCQVLEAPGRDQLWVKESQ